MAKTVRRKVTNRSARTTARPRHGAPRAKDKRCYFCRKKAVTFVGGHPSCGGDHGVPRIIPQVRPKLRSGRGSFIRALRSKIEKVRSDQTGVDADYRDAVLGIFDAAAARYAGE